MLGETTTIVSVGEREAQEVVDKASRHLAALEQLGSHWAKHRPRVGDVATDTGGRIIALPSTSGGRSYSGNVILDEFAYHTDPARVWDGAAAVVMHGGKLRVLSTPNGVGNMWHQLWSDDKAHRGYRLHEVTIDHARADGMRVSEDECWRMARGDPRVYDQLFRGKFLDGEQQYISSAAIAACSVDDTYCHGGDCYAGLDIGRTSDRTELVVVKRDHAGIRWQVARESCKRTSLDDVQRLAALAFGPRFSCRRLCVDATGLGIFPAEELQRRFGRTRVEPVPFTAASKEDLATGLYSAFADCTVRIVRSDEQLREDIAAIRRIVTSAGNVRYDAPVTDKGHADAAWALALALHACSGPGRRKHEIAPHGGEDDDDEAV